MGISIRFSNIDQLYPKENEAESETTSQSVPIRLDQLCQKAGECKVSEYVTNQLGNDIVKT